MKELQVFQQMFSLPADRIITWMDLLGVELVWGPELVEKTIVMRFLVDELEESKALRLVKKLYLEHQTTPVLSIVNRRYLDVGWGSFDMDTLEQTTFDQDVFTSLAVNVERFAATACALQRSSFAGHLECSADLSADEVGEGCQRSAAEPASCDRLDPGISN